MAARSIRLLLVEDDEGDARLVREILRGTPVVQVERVDRLAQALTHLSKGGADVVLLDLGLPDSKGLDTLRAVTQSAPLVPVVVLTGHDDEATGQQAVREGAQDYLTKGLLAEHALGRTIRYALERGESQARLVHLNQVLAAFRSISQLVVREKDPRSLIGQACEMLVHSGGYLLLPYTNHPRSAA